MALISRVALYGIVLLALFVVALHVTVEQTEYWRAPVIHALEQRAQASVEVQSVDANISAYNMKIDLRDMTLRAAETNETTAIGRMVIDVNLWQSLLRREWVANTISIFDTQWHVTTDAAGHVDVANSFLVQEEEGTTVLVDAAITWATPAGEKTLPPALIAVKTSGKTTAFDIRLRESPGRNDAIRLSGELDFMERAMLAKDSDGDGDERRWGARAYFEAQEFDIDTWRARLPFIKLNEGVLSAKLDIERTLDGEVRVGGEARLENYRLWNKPHTMSGRMQGRWHEAKSFVAISNLSWDSADATWQNGQAQIWDDEKGRMRISLHVPQFDRLELNSEDFSATVLRASIDAQGQLRDNAWRATPTFDAIREMRIRAQGEAIELAYRGTRERYENMRATSTWTMNAGEYVLHVDELSMQSGDARYQSTGRVVLEGDQGHAQLSAFVEEIEVEQFQRWSSALAEVNKELDAASLQDRLRAGEFRNTHVLVTAPIREGQIGAPKTFSARGQLMASEWAWPTRDGSLALSQVDADFHFSDRETSATVHRARVNNIDAKAQYEARHGGTPQTAVTATLSGEINELLAALRSVGAMPATHQTQGLAFAGPSEIIVSATSAQGELSANDFRGELAVDGARAMFARSTRATISDLSGKVRFAKQAIEFGDLQGQINGAPIRISVERQRSGIVARAEGELDLFDWLHAGNVIDSAWASSARSIIRGATRWQGEWRDSPKGASISLASNLQGAEVRLPAPFSVSKAETRPLNLQSAAGTLQVRYGEGDRMARGRITTNQGALVGGLRIGAGKLLTDDEKMMVRGRIASPLRIAEWLPLLTDDAQSAAPPRRAPHWDVDLEFDEVSVLEQAIGQAGMRLVSDENNVFMSVASTPLQGVLLKQRKTNVSLTHLHLFGDSTRDEKDAARNVNPLNIPAFNLTIARMRLGETTIRDFTGEIRPIANGVSIQNMRFMTTATTVNLNGLWTVQGDETESRFTFEMLSNDFGQFLQDGNLLENLEGGEGSASGELTWRGAPWQFSLENTWGGILIDLKNGQLKHTELGVGRLVGLFNTAAVVRRINLDFKDVFAQGLSFDTMRGSFQIRDQNVHISNLEIDGLSTNIRIKGRTGLVARDYDQRMRVIVKLREGLPVVGALVGGPLAAIGVYLVDQVTNVSGMLDQVATLEYRITGSWEQPVIEFVRVQALENIDERLRNLGRSKDASDNDF